MRATIGAVVRSRGFIRGVGTDLHHLSLAALVSGAAVTFPVQGASHPLYAAALAVGGVVLYALSAIIAFQFGGNDDD